MTPFDGLEPIRTPPANIRPHGHMRYSVDGQRQIMDYLSPDCTVYRRVEERGYHVTWYIVR